MKLINKESGLKTIFGIIIGFDETLPEDKFNRVIFNLQRQYNPEFRYSFFWQIFTSMTWFVESKLVQTIDILITILSCWLNKWFGLIVGSFVGYLMAIIVVFIPVIIQLPLLPYFAIKVYMKRKVIAYAHLKMDKIYGD